MKIDIDKLSDLYLNNAITLDALAVFFIWTINTNFPIWELTFIAFSDRSEFLSNLVATCVSLAGFILASLTIIATLRSNLGNKPLELAKNPLELFFSATNYKRLVNAFKYSIVELVFTAFVLCITWLFLQTVNADHFFQIIVGAIYLIFASVFRALSVLFTIMSLE